MVELPSGIHINTLVSDLRAFSWEACETLLYYSKILKKSKHKNNILKNNDNEDPVTLADLEVNQIIIQRIKENYKQIDWEILSEENAKIDSFDCDTKANWLWILDPLDGTKDFVEGTSNYAMHLALNYKQKPFLGIVLIPEREELWIAIDGNVWCENRDGAKKSFKKSNSKILNEMILVTSKNHRNLTLKNLIDKLTFKEVIEMGSIGCKIASIIRGESDVYICLSMPGKSSPKDWDFAAPAKILLEAGGAITSLENKELTYNQPNFQQGGIIIASKNIELHESLCSHIKVIIKKYNLYPLAN